MLKARFVTPSFLTANDKLPLLPEVFVYNKDSIPFAKMAFILLTWIKASETAST
jgi:hypothetical protein